MQITFSIFAHQLFPVELKQKVLLNLSPAELIAKSSTCREWQAIANHPMTWEYYSSEAQSGNLETIRQLALIYLVGKSRPRDEKFGFALAEKFADQISSRSLISPSEKLLFGLSRFDIINPGHSLDLICNAFSQLPNIRALFKEGNPFSLFIEALKNLSEGQDNFAYASLCLTSSAAKSFDLAFYALASFKPDFLKDLLERKSREAQYMSYRIARNSDMGGPFRDDSLKALRNSAASNYPAAQFALSMHLHKEGNLEEALKWALKAAILGHKSAQYFIGKHSKNLADLSHEEAVWISEAMQASENLIYFHLGKISEENQKIFNEHELGILRDIDNNLDKPSTQWTYFPYLMYLLHKSGHGVKKSEKQALEFYKQLENMDPEMADLWKKRTEESS